MSDNTLLRLHPHPLGYFSNYFIGALVTLSPIFLAPIFDQVAFSVGGWINAAAVFAGLLVLASTELVRRIQTYTITDAGIEYNYTFITTRSEFVEYESIEEIQANQGILDRIFNIGRIVIETAGEATKGMEINYIQDPQAVASLIREHMKENPKRE